MSKGLVFILAAICSVALFVGVSQAAGRAKQPKGTVILKGAPMGGVKFEHKLHSETYAAKKCETCHHAASRRKPPARRSRPAPSAIRKQWLRR